MQKTCDLGEIVSPKMAACRAMNGGEAHHYKGRGAIAPSTTQGRVTTRPKPTIATWGG
jgi:hypothetical protein